MRQPVMASSGHAVHGERARIQTRLDLGHGAELEALEHQMLIHIVGEDPDMRMLHQHIGDGPKLVFVVAGAGGVGGLVEDQPFGLGRIAFSSASGVSRNRLPAWFPP